MNRVAESFATDRSANLRPKPASASQSWVTAKDLREMIDPIEKTIMRYPGVALASAFIVGVTIGWLIKRK